MQIVSRRTMLALPVERLVGNSTNSNNGSRTRPPMMTMSPDSSPSDSSRSESPSSTNAKVYSAYSSPNSDKFRSDSTSPPPKSSSRTGESQDRAHDQPHRCSCDNNEDIQFKTEHNNSNSTRDERKEGSNQTEPQPAAAELKQQQQQKIRIIEDDTESLNNKMNNTVGDDSDDNNSIGRPPSRPPSSASSTFTTASTLTFPLSPNSDIKPIPMITRPFHHHHHHHHHHSHHHLQTLKFSIEDILRPEFGKSALRHPPLANNHRRSSNINHNNNGDFYPHSPSSIRNNKEGRDKPNRPSSIKDHSEDSNSSCTSRKEEVVDESKVNPPVPPGPLVWPAWVYCTRYSDRPSSGPRSRRVAKREKPPGPREVPEEKRPRTAFTAEQLARLKQEFDENRYLTEKRRQDLARDLKLHENQIKIWFQNKRAKLKKSTGARGGLAMQLMAQGLYNHSTVPIDEDDEMYEALMQNK